MSTRFAPPMMSLRIAVVLLLGISSCSEPEPSMLVYRETLNCTPAAQANRESEMKPQFGARTSMDTVYRIH